MSVSVVSVKCVQAFCIAKWWLTGWISNPEVSRLFSVIRFVIQDKNGEVENEGIYEAVWNDSVNTSVKTGPKNWWDGGTGEKDLCW